MNEFTVLRNGNEVAEVSIQAKKIKIVPKNLIENLTLLPSLPRLGGILKALREAGYEVTVKKGPLGVTFKK